MITFIWQLLAKFLKTIKNTFSSTYIPSTACVHLHNSTALTFCVILCHVNIIMQSLDYARFLSVVKAFKVTIAFTWQLEWRFLHAGEVHQECDLQVVGLTTTELPSSQSSPTQSSCQRTWVTAVTVQELSPTHQSTAAAATTTSLNKCIAFTLSSLSKVFIP